MTSDSSGKPEEIQFDQAEFNRVDDAQLICSGCNNPITSTYYDAGGKTVCPACRNGIEADLSSGNGVGRFVRATLYGVPAAGLGAGIYYGISALTGYEFGLVAIIIGLMVGAAVRAGARRRGGWPYQTLAVVLTYIAIVSTYIPYIVEGFQDHSELDEPGIHQQADEIKDGQHPPKPDDGTLPGNSDGAVAGSEDPSLLLFLMGIALLFAVAMAAPFLAGFENIIGLVIIAFGLYQAWKMNKRNPIDITGPFQLDTADEGMGEGFGNGG